MYQDRVKITTNDALGKLQELLSARSVSLFKWSAAAAQDSWNYEIRVSSEQTAETRQYETKLSGVFHTTNVHAEGRWKRCDCGCCSILTVMVYDSPLNVD